LECHGSTGAPLPPGPGPRAALAARALHRPPEMGRRAVGEGRGICVGDAPERHEIQPPWLSGGLRGTMHPDVDVSFERRCYLASGSARYQPVGRFRAVSKAPHSILPYANPQSESCFRV
jgi:hypothetical protein